MEKTVSRSRIVQGWHSLLRVASPFLADESGTELVEYALVMSMVSIVGIVGVQTLGSVAVKVVGNDALDFQNSGVYPP